MTNTEKQKAVHGAVAYTPNKNRAFPRILFVLATLLGTPLALAVPLEVYGRLPHIENVVISPDGSRIALVKTEKDMRFISIVALADGKQIGGIRAGKEKLRAIRWADNDYLMIETSVTGLPYGFIGSQDEWFMLQVYDLHKNKSWFIPDPDRGLDVTVMNAIAGEVMVRTLDGRTVLFVPTLAVSGEGKLALLRVDLATDDERVVRRGEIGTEGWLLDSAGEILAELDYYQHKERWAIKIRQSGHLQEVAAGYAPIDSPTLLGLGPDGDAVVVAAIEDDDVVWRPLSLIDGKFGPPIMPDKEPTAPIENVHTSRMIGGMYLDDDARYVFFDAKLQKRWESVVRAFASEHVRLVSHSDDFSKIVVRVDGTHHGFQYLLVDMNTYHADSIGDVYEGIKEPHDVKRINYEAADGFKIPAYLTLPSGRAVKNLPLIVLPHGGPAARDTAEFDWWSQALADQGYAVLQPNYRGSNLNAKFEAAGFGEFGHKMQTDLSDGVRYLAKEGIADPTRVCIVGASYGGYAALAGVTLDPGVYRCAVSVAGLSDLPRMLRDGSEGHGYGKSIADRYWDRFMGVKGPNDPALDAISPIKHIDAVNVPVLLIHGRDDSVVPFEQSAVILNAMRRAKKPVELVTLKNEDHWLSRSETRLQMLQSSVAFLRTHNPPDPQAAAAVQNP